MAFQFKIFVKTGPLHFLDLIDKLASLKGMHAICWKNKLMMFTMPKARKKSFLCLFLTYLLFKLCGKISKRSFPHPKNVSVFFWRPVKTKQDRFVQHLRQHEHFCNRSFFYQKLEEMTSRYILILNSCFDSNAVFLCFRNIARMRHKTSTHPKD